MQVKQQKMSSNKWNCAVCNQKQSVRKVVAQSPMAKDIRHFVQSFNMSRKLADDTPQPETEQAPDTTPHLDLAKRRTDWSEYLDPLPPPDSPNEEQQMDIVTELPREVFKRPKLTAADGGGGGDDDRLYKPFFCKRNNNSQGKEPTIAKGGSNSKWSKYMNNNDITAADSESQVDAKSADVVLEYLENLPNHERVEDAIHPDFL
ncbi:hypothetical protein HS088_TW15G00894 [Tripterygium wilfordii]|uniref:MRN complex-interacting protein N-terminal domain-containing protein n=2 Tax=Tripterygium wilfordii TaxID=458696 RepID=A0A7J7CMT2_TRIWF|nr:hypothetical protein HS088_TW15G00894 [Tripterygium wilfordii]